MRTVHATLGRREAGDNRRGVENTATQKKKGCLGYNGPWWMTSPSRGFAEKGRKKEGSRRFAKLEEAKQYQMQCLVELRRRCSRMVEDEARGRSLFEGSGLERVHRVENWVPNLFKYYFFFFFSRSPL